VSAPNEIPAPIESPNEFSSGDFHLEDSSSMPVPNDAQEIVDKKYHGDVDLFTSEDAKQVKLNMNSLSAIKYKLITTGALEITVHEIISNGTIYNSMPGVDHAVTLIGYDDNFDRSRFSPRSTR
jgi:C1A family cysteine protease